MLERGFVRLLFNPTGRLHGYGISRAFSVPAVYICQSVRPQGQTFRNCTRCIPNGPISFRRVYQCKELAVQPCRLYSSTQSDSDKARNGPVKCDNNSDLVRENIYTLPNALTLTRILACPFLGWSVLDGNYALATGILVYAGISDLVDGFLARKLKMHSVLGTILDPAADKILVTTLTITLMMKSLLPLPLVAVIISKDVLLGLSAFYIRYKTLPPPKNFHRYWDFSIPSAEVHPTLISKANTTLQLLLMGLTTISPLIGNAISIPMQALQWIVAGTTIWSGLSYVCSRSAVRIISHRAQK